METRVLASGATVRADEEHMGLVMDIERKMADEQMSWIEALEAMGVKAAHPDDGWVHRYLKPGEEPSGLTHYTRNEEFESIHWSYPYFREDLEPGDMIALGWPYHAEKTRIVLFTYTTPYQKNFPERGPWSWHFVNVVKLPPKGADLDAEYRADVVIDHNDMVIRDKRDSSKLPRLATENELIAARLLEPTAKDIAKRVRFRLDKILRRQG